MIPGLPRSPTHVEMETPPPPAEKLPMLDQETYCEGKFCKLPGRIIPPDMQSYTWEAADGEHTLCRHCLTALDGDPRRLFSNNTMYANGFKS